MEVWKSLENLELIELSFFFSFKKEIYILLKLSKELAWTQYCKWYTFKVRLQEGYLALNLATY